MGAFRTEFVSNLKFPAASGPSGVSPAYLNTKIDDVVKYTTSLVSKAGGDPEKAAKTIVDVIRGTGLAQGKERYLRLPLGSDCKQFLEQKFQVLTDTLKYQEELIRSTDSG